ncbi:MAG: hypothetical protein CSA20_03670 [Deltaproteobacteria bacterium]|nr:MAG: hypothetical protein CSB23_01005 [Deltaproteobacteria bacterium]PIE73197.1 MAG: hypothetical protein CSA20_03670 [Deltaproteobacteria bacterium]
MRIHRYFTVLTLVLFCGLIFSPSLCMMFSERKRWSPAEKRSLAMLPALPENLSEISDYFSEINKYLQDHFGLREVFIHRYERELAKRFDTASLSSKVLKGLDDWYFLDDFGLVNDFFGHTPLSDKELDAWVQEMQKRHSWLKQQGIRYLHVLAPNKQSIYPQYLMKNGRQLQGVTRFNQLQKHLSVAFPDYIVDVHAALVSRSGEGQLYFKKDSHWNKKGAYFAYLEIVKKLSQWFPEQTFRADFAFDADVLAIGGNLGNGGDLLRMVGLNDKTDLVPVLQPYKECVQRDFIENYALSDIVFSPLKRSFKSTCSQRQLRAVVFRDSFFSQMEPFFSENFKEVIYLWKSYNQKNIEEIMRFWKPDLVMEMTVERHAFDFLWTD